MSNGRQWPLALALVLAGGLAPDWALLRAESQEPAQAPVFRSGVELITVDVTVVDSSGNPIKTLRPDQFRVTIDGRPRQVVSADLIEYAAGQPGDGATPTRLAARATFSSNDSPVASAAPGRLVFLAVDQGSFRPMAGRAATDAANRFLDRLQALDRVGLIVFPMPGPSLAPSTDRAAVRQALNKIVGTGQALRSTRSLRRLSLAESIDIDEYDENALTVVAGRECRGLSGAELQLCTEEIKGEARDIALMAQRQAMQTVGGLRDAIAALARIPERKTIVLLSAGMPTADRAGKLDLQADIAVIGRQAAAVNANIFVLHVDNSFVEAYSASERFTSSTPVRDQLMMKGGLDTMASASGGSLFTIVGGADGAFERVVRETAASYVLAVDPMEGDRNGRPHSIRVSVDAPGAQVRSRREFVMVPTSAEPETPEVRLAAALQAQRLARELPVGVSTHTLGQAENGEMRVLLTAHVGRGLTAPLDVQVSYSLTDPSGRSLGTATERKRLPLARASDDGAASFVTAIGVRPGDYLLRLAFIDESGRLGSVEHWFSAALASGDGLRLGDLLLLDPVKTPEDDVAPVVDGRVHGRAMATYIEIFPRSTDGPLPWVTFGISDQHGGPMLLAETGVLNRKDSGRSLIAEALLNVGLLPPGDYVARVAVDDGVRLLAELRQPFRIERSGR